MKKAHLGYRIFVRLMIMCSKVRKHIVVMLEISCFKLDAARWRRKCKVHREQGMTFVFDPGGYFYSSDYYL